MSPGLSEVLKPFRFQLTVIWLGLVASVPAYIVVATMVARGGARPPAPDTTFVTGFAALSVLAAAGSLLVPRFYPSKSMIASAMSGSTDPEALARDPESHKVNEAAAATIRQLDGAERRVLLLRPLFQVQAILRCALAEVVATVGLILVFLGSEVGTLLPFAAAAFVLQILAFPRFDPFVEQATGSAA